MNRNLGNYDMVLALSSSKINFQFKKMYQRGIIHRDWAFLTNSMGQEIKPLTNEETKNFWNNIDINKSSLDAKKEEFEFIDQQMTTAIEKEEWSKVKELKAKKETVKTEVEKLQARVNEANLYDLGLIANIAEPKIEILSETSKELIFQVSFKPGSTLFYTREGKKAEYNLGENGIKYAFRVSIGTVKIKSDKKIIEISEDGKEKEITLRDKGINDNDFTIKSLFLDFENANIADYDSGSSILPKDARENALLQAAMVNYFKNLASSDNPYVLGYAINKNEVQEGERGLFYPSGVAYSTSHSKEARASTFNFLMLLNNNPFPSGNDAGVLPTSLMEYAQDTTATVNGVFGLSLSEFEDVYIPLLSRNIKEKIQAKMIEKNKLKSSDFSNKRDFYINYGWDTESGPLSGTLNVKHKCIRQSNSKNGVEIVYELTSSAKVRQSTKRFGFNVDVDWSLSTSGQETPDGVKDKDKVKRGKAGSLIIGIKAGATGKLELAVDSEEMILGFDDKKGKLANEDNKYWIAPLDVLKWLSPLLFIIDAITEIFKKAMNPLKEIKDFGNLLDIQSLENLENKVILPVASVYTYKNVRLLSRDSNDNNNVLLFDTSYGSVAK